MSTKQSLQPAEAIIRKCGGHRKVAEWLGIDVSNVYRFEYSKARGGTDGLIPSQHQVRLLAVARENGIDLGPADFFPATEPMQAAS